MPLDSIEVKNHEKPHDVHLSDEVLLLDPPRTVFGAGNSVMQLQILYSLSMDSDQISPTWNTI